MLIPSGIVILSIDKIIHSRTVVPGSVSVYTCEGGIPSNELIFRFDGNCTANFDNIPLRSKEGSIKYLPKGQGSIVHEAQADGGECINIFFQTNIPLSDKPFVLDSIQFADEFKKLFDKAETVWLKQDTGYHYEAISALYKIIALMQRSDADIPYAHYSKLKPAIEYLNLNCRSNNIDLKYAASLCDISYSHFRRLFSECMGISASSYVAEKKIEYAKEMLLTKQYSISEIAYTLGFRDVFYFSRVFKRVTGQAPSQFAPTV